MKRISSQEAFTLIEILIAGAVLGAVVFAVLRLSTNNAHQITLLESEKSRHEITYDIEQCIRSLGFDGLSNYGGQTGSIDFGSDNQLCLTGTTETGVILKNFSGSGGDTEVNPTEITNYFVIHTGSTSHTIDLTTSTEKNSETTEFVVYK